MSKAKIGAPAPAWWGPAAAAPASTGADGWGDGWIGRGGVLGSWRLGVHCACGAPLGGEATYAESGKLQPRLQLADGLSGARPRPDDHHQLHQLPRDGSRRPHSYAWPPLTSSPRTPTTNPTRAGRPRPLWTARSRRSSSLTTPASTWCSSSTRWVSSRPALCVC